MNAVAEEKAIIKRVDVAKALKLRTQGNTYAEIAAVFGVSPTAVHKAIHKFEDFLTDAGQPGLLQAFQDNRSSLLNAMEMRMMRSLVDEDAISKASLNNRAYAFEKIHQARRLEEGKSTENVSVLGKLILSAEDNLGNTKGKASASDPETK
jgi:predicted DNA-binding protein YlxM (UPF0122 family)